MGRGLALRLERTPPGALVAQFEILDHSWRREHGWNGAVGRFSCLYSLIFCWPGSFIPKQWRVGCIVPRPNTAEGLRKSSHAAVNRNGVAVDEGLSIFASLLAWISRLLLEMPGGGASWKFTAGS